MFMRSQQDTGKSYEIQRPFAWAKRAALIGVLAGFSGVIVYVAMNQDSLTSEELNPAVIQAPQSAVKERPTEPTGMQVAHQDKEVFDLLADEESVEDVKKEAAQMVEQAQNNTKEAVRATESAAQKAADEAQRQADEAARIAAEKAKAAAAEAQRLAEEAAQESKQTASEVVETVEQKTQEAVVATKEAVKADGSWGVQLGSFRSQADAEKAVDTFTEKFSEQLSNLNPTVKKVELSKGTFYRVIFSGLASSKESSEVCAQLQEKNQGCINAKL